MSRPKKMLPVLGQEPAAGVAAPSVGTATREEPGYDPSVDGSERTVVRVEEMDCASCAVTVERRVATLPGVHRATAHHRVPLRPGDLDARNGGLGDRGGVEAGHPSQGRGCARSAGGYLIWGWLRPDGPLAWALFGAAILALYGLIAALQPIDSFGRVYATYGGVFIALALGWGVLVEGWRPDRYDVLGATIAIVGVIVMVAPPRG